MVGIYECFTMSGFFKIFESVAVFTCLMLHRIGYVGKQVWHTYPVGIGSHQIETME